MPTKEVREKVEEQKKGPLQCWGCGEAHLLRDYPYRQHDNKIIYNVQEATTINDVARNVPRIYAVVENRQGDHQSLVVTLKL